MALIVLAISGFGIVRTQDPELRWAFAFAMAWILAGQYFLHRGMWSATLQGDAALSTVSSFTGEKSNGGVTFFARVLQWSFGPVVLSIVTFILVMAGIANRRDLSVRVMMPFCALFAFWMVAVVVRRSRSHRALQREIDELNEIERESSR